MNKPTIFKFSLGLLLAVIPCFTMQAQHNPPKLNGVVYNPDGISLTYVEGSGNIKGFFMGRFEVTQAQWQTIMGSNPSNFKGDNLPVEMVNWNDVKEFLKKLNEKIGRGYRLPTEAEWEYAAKGGTNNNTYEYAGSNNIGEVAWYNDNSGSITHAVGTKKPNALEIYDMSGNVWEWCEDCWDSSCSYRVARGGCWSTYASACRVAASRNYDRPGSRSTYLGFRVVLP